MAEQQDDQFQYALSDIGTRIRDLEEKTNSLRERLLMLGESLIETAGKIEERLIENKKQNIKISQEQEKISATNKTISSELTNFVKKDEILLIERMLKDFEPLDFARKKDLEELKKNLDVQKNKN